MSDDRKYRHRGYMDSDRGESSRRRGPSQDGPQKSEGAPRGRGIDLDKELVVTCKKCGNRIRSLEEVTSASSCPRCGQALHCCAQCRSFDTSARFECTQPIPERVPKKNDRNDCSFFTALVSFDLTGAKAQGTPDDARAAFDRLFKK
jgi:hypothetical protein